MKNKQKPSEGVCNDCFNNGFKGGTCPHVKIPSKESWGVEFEKLVSQQKNSGDPYWPNWDGVKSFIHSLLLSKDSELREKIEKMEPPLYMTDLIETEESKRWAELGWKICKENILSLLDK